MTIEEIIKQVPQWQEAKAIRYEPLSGGYSNLVYKVFVDDKTYALRINGIQNEYLGLCYEDEIDSITRAARFGLTPMALDCANKTDYLITDFVVGTQLTEEQLKNSVHLGKVVSLLKKLHEIPYDGNRTSTPFSLTRGYLQGAEKLGIKIPADLQPFLKQMEAIEEKRKMDPSYQRHYCHNDPFAHNILRCADGSVKILDWELSGLGDIWFDLATMSFSCGFNQQTDETMLTTYFGECDDQKISTLHEMKTVCMVREIGWALLHTALDQNRANPGPGYMDFALKVLDRLKQGWVTLL